MYVLIVIGSGGSSLARTKIVWTIKDNKASSIKKIRECVKERPEVESRLIKNYWQIPPRGAGP